MLNVMVSPEDLDLLSDPHWHINNGGYLIRNKKKQDGSWGKEFFHRVVAERMGMRVDGMTVDHIDRDKVNNQRFNLRLATHAQNSRNKDRKIGSTGVRGVTRIKDKYAAQIGLNYKKIHLGNFDTKEEAHDAYCRAAKEHHGAFACTA